MNSKPLDSSDSLFLKSYMPEPIFPNWMKGALAVTAAVAITFAVLAGMHYLTPPFGIVAASVGGAEILFIPIWYCVKKSRSNPSFAPLFNGTSSSSRPPDWQRDVFHPHTVLQSSYGSEGWDQMLVNLAPNRANLADGKNVIGENTTAGFHPVPYIGNYDNRYMDFQAPYIQWRLPASQLAGFPEAMQRHFAWYAGKGLLDLYFIGAQDPGGRDLARNLVMHAIVLPEYNPQNPRPSSLSKDIYRNAGGLATNVQIRIFDPEGIDPYPDRYDAIPFDRKGFPQMVNYHPGPYKEVAISPNNARFLIQSEAEYCSFYVGAVYRGRACAFYVVLTCQEINALRTASDSSTNLMEFSSNLEGFPYKENIDRLLINY